VSGGASRETGQGEVGSAGCRVDCDEESDSGNAEGGVERDCGNCVERFEEGGRGGSEAGDWRRRNGSYDELLADGEIEAIYNPLPNHLHVPWSIKAAEAGKARVVREPISLTVAEAKTLLEARERCGVKIGESIHGEDAPAMAEDAGV